MTAFDLNLDFSSDYMLSPAAEIIQPATQTLQGDLPTHERLCPVGKGVSIVTTRIPGGNIAAEKVISDAGLTGGMSF